MDDRHAALGIRGMLLCGVGAWLGLRILNQPSATGVAVLTGLLLLLADFHGDPRRRLRAYLIGTAAGSVLVGAGVAVGHASALPLVLMVMLVTATLSLVRSAGGLLVAAGTTLMADFVVGVAGGLLGEHPAGAILATLIGGLAATGLAFAVRPAPWVSPVRGAAVSLLETCGHALAATASADALTGKSRHLLDTYVSRPERPASPLPSAQASIDLLADVAFLSDLLAARQGPLVDPTAGALVLASAHCVRHPHSAPARQALTATLARFDEMDSAPDFDARAIRYVGRSIGVAALRMTPPRQRRPAVPFRDYYAGLGSRLGAGNPVLRTAAATAMLFGGLVWLTEQLKSPHPQWILLVAVSAFYPYARRAASKAGFIVAGTLAGVVVFTGLAALLSPNSPWWWALLVVAAGVSMSAAHSLVGTLVGQGFFTLLSLTLVNLAAPATGVSAVTERAADVVIGAAAAVVVAIVLAPRGMRQRMRRALAQLLLTAHHVAAAQAAVEPQSSQSGAHPSDVRREPDRSCAVRMRNQFLRCVDVADVGSGSTGWDDGNAAEWLDAARRVAQTCTVVEACRPLDADHADAQSWRQLAETFCRQSEVLVNGGEPPRSVVLPIEGASDISEQGARWLLHNADVVAVELAGLAATALGAGRAPTPSAPLRWLYTRLPLGKTVDRRPTEGGRFP